MSHRPPIICLALASCVLGAGCRHQSSGADHDGGSRLLCNDSTACPTGQRCVTFCIPDNGTCSDDNDCQNDTYCYCSEGGGNDMGDCVGGICVPYGAGPRGQFDPTCSGPGFAATDFLPPVEHCKWTGDFTRTTPVVIDLDGDGKSEMVFSSFRYSDTPPTSLVAVRGDTCEEIWRVQTDLALYSHLAAADLDGDKVPEIVGVGTGNTVKVFDAHGNLLATSPTPYDFGYHMNTNKVLDTSAPAIAQIDGQGPPEIAVAGQVLRYVSGNPNLTVLWTQPVIAAEWGTLDNIADLDGDGTPEVIVGAQIFDGVTGADKTPSALRALGVLGGYPAVADFNKDGKPDVVMVQSKRSEQQVFVLDYTNNKVIFGPFGVVNGGFGGPPTVADFDGDGVPDFGLASTDHYYVYALRCAQDPIPADCLGADPGVLWEKPTQDGSSGGTGSAVFDFNGDGAAEVVYRDECWLRVYNGPDGKVLFAVSVTSGTLLEYPVVADVDGDGHADIVVSADAELASICPQASDPETNTPWTGAASGIYVYRDPMNRWMPSRRIWNEHAYHVTNVNEDATIPDVEEPNWLTLDNYRQNVQGKGTGGGSTPQVDLTAGASIATDQTTADCVSNWTLRANLCNRGSTATSPGVPGSFYDADPRSGSAAPLCTVATTTALQPGQCEAVSCDWVNPPSVTADLWFRAGDDGMPRLSKVSLECKAQNDLLFLPGAVCVKVR